MKVAYITIKDAKELGKQTEWSGTGYYIARSLEQQGVDVDYLGPLSDSRLSQIIRKSKRLSYKNLRNKLYIKDTDPLVLRNLSTQVATKLKRKKYDVVLSATVNPIAYLECDLPIIFWADATFVNTAEFYPEYSNLCKESVKNGHEMEKLALQKCRFAIYSSEWAAEAAINYYGADPQKVRVINFGANLDHRKTLEEIKGIIKARPTNICKLLFLGKDWFRKGGSVAFKVAKALNESGLNTELTVVGCEPIDTDPLPEYVKTLGFISKYSEKGREKLAHLISNSHFLILPTIADCSPIVLAEACSLGVPCLTTSVGGIPSIIKDDVNGKLFQINSAIESYVAYILNLFASYSKYQSLALSSFQEYYLRLNWMASSKILRHLLEESMERSLIVRES